MVHRLIGYRPLSAFTIHLHPCHLTPFAVRLFAVAKGVVSVQKSDKLEFKVRDRESIRVSVGIRLVVGYCGADSFR